MKALVLGCGSIGLRHITHLRQLGVSDIRAADPSPLAREKAQAELGITVMADPEEALQARSDVVLVCTPAATHVPMAQKALEAGAHVFVEKPLSTSLEGTEVLLAQVRADSRVVQVGYNLRYHPAIRGIQRILASGRLGRVLTAHLEFGLYLPKWWKNRDYRTSYMARSNLGGGLLLDGSHEVDLAILFLGPVQEVTAFGGKLSGLEMQGLDAVKVLMRMERGSLVSLSIDCLQPTYTRSYSLIGENAALRWDCSDGRADGSLGRLVLCTGADRYEPVPVQGDPLATYLDQLRAFLDSVSQGRAPEVGVESGMEVIRVAQAVEKALKTGASVRVA